MSADPLTVTLPREAVFGIFIEMCSEVSERCYCAGWISWHAEALPPICAEAIRTGKPQEYGQDEVYPSEAQTLTTLAEALGGWDAAFAPKLAYLKS